jgi:Cys-rich protein (TIGR01571 family)
LIICKEEAGLAEIDRKNFSNFLLFNLEPMSAVSFVAPCVPLGQCAAKAWGGSQAMYLAGFGLAWFSVILLCFLGLADKAFYQMAGAAYFCFGILAGVVRTSVRTKLGITGDMLTDGLACCFWMPFAMGQMAGQDFSDIAEAPVPKVVDQEAAKPITPAPAAASVQKIVEEIADETI